MTVTLAVAEGTLNVTAGTSGAVVTNSGTSSVTITGTVAQINNLLTSNATSTVSYIDNTDTPSASSTLTLTVHDNGNTGTGGDLVSVATSTINITAVNDFAGNVIDVDCRDQCGCERKCHLQRGGPRRLLHRSGQPSHWHQYGCDVERSHERDGHRSRRGQCRNDRHGHHHG